MKRLSALACAALLSSLPARANVPQRLAYAGVLTDDDGTPVTGSRDFRILICANVSNGHCESPYAYDSGAAFSNYLLGPDGSFTLDMDPFDANRVDNGLANGAWLELLVNATGQVTLVTVGLHKITSVPFSHRSVTSERALTADSAQVAMSVDYSNVQNVPDPPTCSPGKFLTWTSGGYLCLSPAGFSSVAAPLVVNNEVLTLPNLDITSLVGSMCDAGEVLAHSGSGFVCLMPTAGTGVRVTANGSSLNYSVDFSSLCEPDQLIAADPNDGAGYSCVSIGTGLMKMNASLQVNESRYVNTAGDAIDLLTVNNALIVNGGTVAGDGIRIGSPATGKALVIEGNEMTAVTHLSVEPTGAMSINTGAAAASVYNGSADSSSVALKVVNNSADVEEPAIDVANGSANGRVARFMEGTTPRLVINGSGAMGGNIAEFGAGPVKASVANDGAITAKSFAGDGSQLTGVRAKETLGRPGGAYAGAHVGNHSMWKNNFTRFNVAALPSIGAQQLRTLASDGRRIWVWGSGAMGWRVDPQSGAATQFATTGNTPNVNAASMMFDGRYMNFSNNATATIMRFDTLGTTADAAATAVTLTGGSGGALAFDGTKMWNFGLSGYAAYWTPGASPTVTTVTAVDTERRGFRTAYSPTHGLFVLAVNNTQVAGAKLYKINTSTGAATGSADVITAADQTRCGVATVSNVVVFACGGSTGGGARIYAYDAATMMRLPQQLNTGTAGSDWTDIASDGRYIVALGDEGATFIDFADPLNPVMLPSRPFTVAGEASLGLSQVLFDGEHFFGVDIRTNTPSMVRF